MKPVFVTHFFAYDTEDSDEVQLGPFPAGTKGSIFANYVNKRLLERYVELNASQHALRTQYCTIQRINALASTIVYKGSLLANVNPFGYPSVSLVAAVLAKEYDHIGELIIFDISSEAEQGRAGRVYAKQV
ncbi:hypothetical protein MMC34_002346 [Xylographa carneopallida]|nr:hypothetical protein [Xylographa carneopallida]